MQLPLAVFSFAKRIATWKSYHKHCPAEVGSPDLQTSFPAPPAPSPPQGLTSGILSGSLCLCICDSTPVFSLPYLFSAAVCSLLLPLLSLASLLPPPSDRSAICLHLLPYPFISRLW